MKFDHFPCKGLPEGLRAKFNELKEDSKQQRYKKASPKVFGHSSSTAQYYHDSALKPGMVDAHGGIFMAKDLHMISNVQADSQGSSVPITGIARSHRL